jgi:hypothetical protein
MSSATEQPAPTEPAVGTELVGGSQRFSAPIVRKNTGNPMSSSQSVSGAAHLSPEAAAAIHDDLQYEKLRKNFEVLSAEMASVQAATTTMDSCTRCVNGGHIYTLSALQQYFPIYCLPSRIIQFVESREEPLAPGAAANRPDPWVDAGGGCCVIS